MAAASKQEQDLETKIQETRHRFQDEFVPESTQKYDGRDVERLLNDEALVASYLTWRQFVVDDTLKMIDESFQWRKEFNVNDLTEGSIPRWMFETGAVYLHGYDKEGNKLFWFRVKLHVKDAKTILDKKKYVAFWLERYVKREPGMPLTVIFDMSESGISNIECRHAMQTCDELTKNSLSKNKWPVYHDKIYMGYFMKDMDFVRYIINCFRVYYPKSLSKMILYEMPWIMNAAWKIVKTWLGPEAINKLKFVSRSEVQSYIDAEHLPPHMGGTDKYKYTYPPLPDDDFLSPVCENGPMVSEDESEMKEAESKTSLDNSFNMELTVRTKKVNFAEESDRSETLSRFRGARKPLTTFKGTLLHVSPSEELCFGSRETERKCLIILNNITSNHVAFKVRTTAPEKYRVKPSSSTCEPGTNVDIVVSLHGGFQASPQDRFLIMAAEMEPNAGTSDLSHFWKEVLKSKIMEHRLRCHLLKPPKSIMANLNESVSDQGASNVHDLQTALTQIVAANLSLEQKLETCLWLQKVLLVMVSVLLVFTFSAVYSD